MSLPRRLALAVPGIRSLYDSRETLRTERDILSAKLDVCVRKGFQPDSVFYHFNTSFDAIAVMERHALLPPQSDPDYLTNFLGVRIDPKFFPTILEGRKGEIEPIPIPANWHSDIAEWGAALRAVDLARQAFTVVELGCGWGCWMNNAGVAARRLGLEVTLVGVEGDAKHVEYAKEACIANGFSASQVTVHHGIAAGRNGLALFPRQSDTSPSWGLEPIFDATDEQLRHAALGNEFDELPMFSLEDVFRPHARIDLLHIDIQGGEADLVESGLPQLVSKVAYMVVGTHSREIEGRLLHTLLQAGWLLEIERPCSFSLSGALPHILVDGVQGWRNPRLAT